MRIAYIITWNLSHNDGVTRKVLRQVQEWKDLGHEVQVFCATEKKGENIPGVHFFIKDHVWSSPLAAIRIGKFIQAFVMLSLTTNLIWFI